MNKALTALMTGAIDYAGLFPPAKLGMAEAVAEYLETKSGADAWVTDKFVIGAKAFEEFEAELERQAGGFEGDLEVECSLVTAPVVSGEQAHQVFHRIEECLDAPRARVEALEIKMPTGKALTGCLKALAKEGLEDLELPFYFEFSWDEEAGYAIEESAAFFEAVGFKARTGGVTADLFPSALDVAKFLVAMASLDTPFKFTAGLHEPIRYEDRELGVMRHGFLNVMLAGALALEQDLNEAEVEEVLLNQGPTAFSFGDEGVNVLSHRLSVAEIEEFWESFGGFGSCSVREPLDGLKRLGY